MGRGYQELRNKGINIDKNLKVTFAVIEKMHYTDFNNGTAGDDFKPSDIVDEDETIGTGEDDEILRKFKTDKSDFSLNS